MASILKVVAVCARWSLLQVVVRLGADLGQQDCQLSWPIMFCGRRPAALSPLLSCPNGDVCIQGRPRSARNRSARVLSLQLMRFVLDFRP